MANAYKNTSKQKDWRAPRGEGICIAGYLGMLTDKDKSYEFIDEDMGEKLPLELQGLKQGETISIKAERYQVRDSKEEGNEVAE